MRISVRDKAGDFAENKDTAKNLRMRTILPALRRGEEVYLNFEGVTGTTQSFIHALIADAIREDRLDALDLLVFENCSALTKSIIEIVVSYSQDEWENIEEDLD